MMRLSTRRWMAAGILARFAWADAAAPTATPPAAPADPSPSRLTIQQLMATRVDPSADVLWDSVAFIASARGEEDRRPRSPAEWDAVRRSALSLIQAADDLRAPGRRVTSIDQAPGPGELSAAAIQRLIDSKPAAFARRARVLKSAANRALTAIDAKDADALMTAGGIIDEACEGCHVTYWYPHR
jgi:cytochrome c556